MRRLPKFTLVHSRKPSRSVRSKRRRAKLIGIWDLGAWVGGLPHVVEALNASQQQARFFEVQAALPAGLRSSAAKLKEFAENQLHRPLTTEETEDARDAILDEDFLPRGEAVRRDLRIDYLVGISPAPLAGIVFPSEKESPVIYFDLFNSSDRRFPRVSIVSVDGVRPLVAEAQRPYEMVVGYIAVRAVLVNLGNDELGFHDDSGCLFDFTDDRRGIVHGLRKPQIEDECLKKIQPRYRKAALSMIHALDAYRAPPQEK